jgi:hypothetical protein
MVPDWRCRPTAVSRNNSKVILNSNNEVMWYMGMAVCTKPVCFLFFFSLLSSFQIPYSVSSMRGTQNTLYTMTLQTFTLPPCCSWPMLFHPSTALLDPICVHGHRTVESMLARLYRVSQWSLRMRLLELVDKVVRGFNGYLIISLANLARTGSRLPFSTHLPANLPCRVRSSMQECSWLFQDYQSHAHLPHHPRTPNIAQLAQRHR